MFSFWKKRREAEQQPSPPRAGFLLLGGRLRPNLISPEKLDANC